MDNNSGWGCFFVLLAIGIAVAALISLAALIDPFDWMPSVAQIWHRCEGDCDLSHRFPDFWGRALANLAYVTVSACVLLGLGVKVAEMREVRRKLFTVAGAAARLRQERRAVAGLAASAGVLGALPLLH